MSTLITCPTCDAAYAVPAETLGAGRTVRCRRCRSEWFAVADGAIEAADAEEISPPPEAAVEQNELPAPANDDVDEGERPGPILSLDEASGVDVVDRPDAQPSQIVDVAPRAARKFSLRRAGAARRPAPSKRQARSWRPRASVLVVAACVAAFGVLIAGRVAIVRASPSLASLYAAVGFPVNVRGLAIRDLRSAEEMTDGAPQLVVTGLVENVSDAPLEVPRLRLAVTARGSREIYAWTTVAARPKLQPGETATFRARLASPPAEGQAISVRFLAKRDLMAALGH